MICDRCGADDKMIFGSHNLPNKSRPFQICFKCDDEVFFEDKDWSDLSSAAKKARTSGRIGRPKKWNSDKEKNDFHNAKRREKKGAAK